MAVRERGGRGKTFRGTVRRNKMLKTVVVEVISKKKHPLYHKYVPVRQRFFAHDETNALQIGDVVEILECRPLSKNKTWRVTKVLQKAEIV